MAMDSGTDAQGEARRPRIADLTDTPLAELVRLDGGAVVTGAAKGLGAAIARRLAEAGAGVVLADVDVDGAASVAEAINADTGGRALPVAADVTDSAALGHAAELAVLEFGSLVAWVNNAGIFPTTGPAIDASGEFISRMLDVNVRGTFAGCQAAARSMAPGGAIVNLSSITALRESAGISAYIASKHAVIGVTRSFAVELAPRGIRVNALAPGLIDTPGVADQLAPLAAAGRDLSAGLRTSPLSQRAGMPDDVARAALFLVCGLGAWVTGEVIAVDGGQRFI